MGENYILNSFEQWITNNQERKHALAIQYIENNIDILETDLKKFMDDCPTSCQLEVYDMLLKAGIDMKDYVFNNCLKKWDVYIHEANPQFQQYYSVDYKQKLVECMHNIVKWEKSDCIVLDTIPAVEEA